MSISPDPIVEQQPATSRPRDWRMFFAGVAVAWLVPLAVAYRYGPASHTDYEDPLTGRTKRESIWLGITLSSKVEVGEVAEWADRNSLSGMYPAKYGWSVSSTSVRWWFTGTLIACGGYGIPYRISDGQIVVPGLTREETLQKYQAECVTAYEEHGSLMRIQEKWFKLAK